MYKRIYSKNVSDHSQGQKTYSECDLEVVRLETNQQI